MMSFKKTFVMLAAGVACLAVSPAMATSFSGTGSFTYNPASGKGTFGDFGIPAGNFTDTITLTTAKSMTLSNVLFDFTGLTGVTATFDGTALGSAVSPAAGFSRLSLSHLNTAAGTQTLVISGHSTGGSTPNIYFGSLVYAVPEPAAWMLMIGGLGIAGMALRRRQKVTTSFRFA